MGTEKDMRDSKEMRKPVRTQCIADTESHRVMERSKGTWRIGKDTEGYDKMLEYISKYLPPECLQVLLSWGRHYWVKVPLLMQTRLSNLLSEMESHPRKQ